MSLRPPIDIERLNRLKSKSDGWIRLAIIGALVAILFTSILTPYGIVQSNRHHNETDTKNTKILHSIKQGQVETHSQLQQVANATACLTHPVTDEPCTTAITETAAAPPPLVVTNTVRVPVFIPSPSPYPSPIIIRTTVAPSPAARPGVAAPSSSPCPALGSLAPLGALLNLPCN